MTKYTVKRSVSPDGKIDSVSVETTFEAEANDTQAVLDAIAESNKYAEYVATLAPAPKTTNVGHMTSEVGQSSGGIQVITGNIQAIFAGEPSKLSGKMGPSAIIIDGTKVKTFDGNIVEHAKNMKDTGVRAKVTYVRNEKWKSNDAKSIEAA
jgi:hypothetical protein